MQTEAYVRKAEELFSAGYNCAQAVAGAFADVTDLSPDAVLRASCAFGGGFARTHNNLCGAVSGMGIIAGLVYGSDDPKSKLNLYPRVQAMTAKFQDTFGSVVCAQLLQNRTKTCKDCVRKAAEILAEDLHANEHI